MRVTTPRTRAARQAARHGKLLSHSNVDEVYKLPDGNIVVVLLTDVARRRLPRRRVS